MVTSRFVATTRKRPAYIHRLADPHHGTGWYVSIKRRGKMYQRQFGDRSYGGTAKARKAAEEYLATLLSVLPKPVLLKRKPPNNSTGVIGVLCIREKTRRGRIIEYFRASWPKVPTGVVYRKFSTGKYGPEQALALAVAARQEAEQQFLQD